MKRFDNFGEYMFDLLFGPLKKGKRAANQFFIFFKVIGRQFDDVKRAFFRVREESDVVSCSPVMLPVHGQDRDMPRLEGEDVEAYRTRLSMKGIISEWGGTRQGILYTLTSLGYEQSRIEPVVYDIPEKWAEFIVFLKGEKQSGVINLDVIDKEIRKVKEGSSRPFYGLEAGNIIELRSRLEPGFSDYPRCGELLCGVWPTIAAEGRLFASELEAAGGDESGDAEFPKVGTFAASTDFWAFGPYVGYFGIASQIGAGSRQESGSKDYLRCSGSTMIDADGTFIITEAGVASRAEIGVEDYMRCSETTYLAPDIKTEEGFF